MNSPPRVVSGPALLGESPVWHRAEGVLYYCDIAGHRLHRLDPSGGSAREWTFDTDVACCAPCERGGLLLAMRDGLWHFDPDTGRRTALAAPPYDPQVERFNDGKCDPRGRFWVGTIFEPRTPPLAALYRYTQDAGLRRMADGVTVSNGLAWSPDGRTLYWTDTTAHTIFALDYDPDGGLPSGRRVFAEFPRRIDGQPLDAYGGRPDGAAVDVDGGYWVAMYEGSRLVRLAPTGQVVAELHLPVRCPTMPCFGGADLRTLFVTSARQGRPAGELDAQPNAGCVFAIDVDVPGVAIPPFRG